MLNFKISSTRLGTLSIAGYASARNTQTHPFVHDEVKVKVKAGGNYYRQGQDITRKEM